MSSSPYSPPEADMSKGPKRPAGPVNSVLTGFAVDVGGTMATGIVLTIIFGLIEAGQGKNAAQIREALRHAPIDSWFSILGIGLGLLMSVLGGYVCARMSQRSDYRLGFILAGCSTLAGMLVGWDNYELGTYIVLVAAGIGAILAGTALAIAQRAK
jgi:formate-dependent nitrite reductase membrane component NrfD